MSVQPETHHADNGGAYIELRVARSLSVASTSDGRYFLRLADVSKPVLAALVADLRASDRVKPSVKEKSADELLDHYLLAQGDALTHLGVLCIGRQIDRARLGTAPVIQFIKRDEHDRKVNKLSWDDHTLSPMALVDAVWREVPDFREFYEIANASTPPATIGIRCLLRR